MLFPLSQQNLPVSFKVWRSIRKLPDSFLEIVKKRLMNLAVCSAQSQRLLIIANLGQCSRLLAPRLSLPKLSPILVSVSAKIMHQFQPHNLICTKSIPFLTTNLVARLLPYLSFNLYQVSWVAQSCFLGSKWFFSSVFIDLPHTVVYTTVCVILANSRDFIPGDEVLTQRLASCCLDTEHSGTCHVSDWISGFSHDLPDFQVLLFFWISSSNIWK